MDSPVNHFHREIERLANEGFVDDEAWEVATYWAQIVTGLIVYGGIMLRQAIEGDE